MNARKTFESTVASEGGWVESFTLFSSAALKGHVARRCA
jgi:hypothetical protein